MPLSTAGRERVLEFVRPLYAGLDGASSFASVERASRRVAAIRGDLAVDDELLELLLLFHGVVERVGSLRTGGRVDLLLSGVGVAEATRRTLLAALDRFEEAPEGAEEELVHDAALLEKTGVAALVTRLLAAGRKRVARDRAVAALDPGPPAERFRTPGGAHAAAERRRAAAAWLDGLRATLESEVAELEPLSDRKGPGAPGGRAT